MRTVSLALPVLRMLLTALVVTGVGYGATHDFGLGLGNPTPTIAERLRLPVGLDGAVVLGLASDGAGAAAGVRVGDVIREINARRVHNAPDAARALQHVQAGGAVLMLVWRQGYERLLRMERADDSGWDEDEHRYCLPE